MADVQPPWSLPLFPLGTVLFPDGWLALQIFEVRYLDMVQRCHAQGQPFGVVCLSDGHEVQQRATAAGASGEGYAREAFFPIGTLAHIETLERPQPGLLRIHCRGSERFEVLQSEKLKHGLWVGQVQALPVDNAVGVPEDLLNLRDMLRDLAQQIKARQPELFEHATEGDMWQDAGWLANRWGELLPLPVDVKQRLMALDNPLLRLELVGDLVDRLPRG